MEASGFSADSLAGIEVSTAGFSTSFAVGIQELRIAPD
jgi:hypothetical protein